MIRSVIIAHLRRPEMASGELKVAGRREAFAEFVGMLDKFPFWFNVVTP